MSKLTYALYILYNTLLIMFYLYKYMSMHYCKYFVNFFHANKVSLVFKIFQILDMVTYYPIFANIFSITGRQRQYLRKYF